MALHPVQRCSEEHQQALSASVKDGMAYSVMLGAGEQNLVPFALFLGASSIQMGLLASLPLLCGACMQLAGVKLVGLLDVRRPILAILSLVQAFFWIPIALLGIWFADNEAAPAMLIVLAAGIHGLNQLMTPVWLSLMGDMVPAEARGAFFGARSKWCGIVMLSSLLLAGLCLELFRGTDYLAYAFLAIFAVCWVARFISGYWMTRYAEPEVQKNTNNPTSLGRFISTSQRSNFGRFCLFLGCWNGAIFICAPFFHVYLLKELQLPYWQFTSLVAIWLGSQFLFMEFWGRIGDKVGNKRILTICGLLLAVNPLLWTLGTSYPYLVGLHLVTGFSYAGMELATSNFLLDSVEAQNRPRLTAYMWTGNALFVLVGSLTGGQLVSYLEIASPAWALESPYLTVMLISTVLRLAVMLAMAPRFKEVRTDIAPGGYLPLLYRTSGTRPVFGRTALYNAREYTQRTVQRQRAFLTSMKKRMLSRQTTRPSGRYEDAA